jgi:hypothetical protein
MMLAELLGARLARHAALTWLAGNKLTTRGARARMDVVMHFFELQIVVKCFLRKTSLHGIVTDDSTAVAGALEREAARLHLAHDVHAHAVTAEIPVLRGTVPASLKVGIRGSVEEADLAAEGPWRGANRRRLAAACDIIEEELESTNGGK